MSMSKQQIDFPMLDPTDPVQARRIQQRRRMILRGKNTVGYVEYLKKVPKHKRRPRSMKHPATPDHKVDIPNKRWQGLVKAWRRALHQYDPPDLQKAFVVENDTSHPSRTNTTETKEPKLVNVVTDESSTATVTHMSDNILDQWEQRQPAEEHEEFLNDSDDDLL